MKRLLICTVMVMSAAAWAGTAPKEVDVTTKEGNVKVKADHMSKNVEVVAHGDTLKIITKEKDWYRVTTPSGKKGWIHVSATTTQKVEIDKDTQVGNVAPASNDEVGLAGKGFKRGSGKPPSTGIPKVKNLLGN